MEGLTGTEVVERRQRLETVSASLLGRLLFEFSYLDTNLGLCLVWVGGGKNLKALSEQVSNFSLSRRLDRLRETVESSLQAGSKSHKAYREWLEKADRCRKIRNELVHGRWDVDPYSLEVINIVGLPTSNDQRMIRYTLPDLEAHVDSVKQLVSELNQLRRRWPI